MPAIFTPTEFRRELESQLRDTDLGVTDTTHTSFPDEVVVRLDNGQEFLVTVSRWGGPRL